MTYPKMKMTILTMTKMTTQRHSNYKGKRADSLECCQPPLC